MAVTVNDSNFEQVVLKSGKPVVVDFWAEWCGPCRAIAPIIEELSAEMAEKAVIAKCDVDSSPNVTMKFGIRNIPTLLFFKNGEVAGKIVGATGKAAISTKIEELI